MTIVAPSDQARLMRLASFASVGAALFLIVLKFGAFLETGSVSLLSSLFDSALESFGQEDESRTLVDVFDEHIGAARALFA